MTGGLGNQMFIYAFYLQMKKRFSDIYIDLSDMMHYKVHHGYEMHRVFDLPKVEKCYPQVLKKVVEFLLFKTFIERKLRNPFVDYTKRPVWPLVYYKGFYQSEKYFKDIEEEVRKAFTFNLKEANRQSLLMIEQMKADASAVSVHIRRGDYLQPKHWASTGCVCQLEYYKNAIAEICKRVENSHFYVFSDDLNWVKENLKLTNAVFVDWNTGKDSWQDMMLMSNCKHNIICNSTFSWWGAWLNSNPEKVVIAPNVWFTTSDTPHILPESWIKVNTK